MDASETLLSIHDLTVHFDTDEGLVEAVNDLSLEVGRGEIVGLVGESGSGKTVTAQTILRLVPRPPARFVAGGVFFAGEDLLTLPIERLRAIRGAQISMIFQEPMTALSPLHRVGSQLSEMLERRAGSNGGMSRAAAWKRSEEWLARVGLPDPAERMRFYPHQLSGGQRQRVMIAMALMMKPKLIIADEPSTALDVTVQAQIFKLLMSMKEEETSLLLITHDLGVVWELCDRLYVMKDSRLVESGPLEALFRAPARAYTRALLEAVPRLHGDGAGRPPPAAKAAAVADAVSPLMEARDLRVWFPVKKGLLARTTGHVKAVDGVSLAIEPGRTLGLVGESGSGKTTLGRALIGLQPVNNGSVLLAGATISGLKRRQLKPHRRDLQMIFQDPYSSLNPRMTVMDILTEGLEEHGLLDAPKRDKAAQLLEEVELRADMASRYPFEFSGGERQRINIARALSLEPKFIVCDEAVSALDVTIQAQIIQLLRRLQEKYRMAYLFISHDLSVVRQLSERIAVMRHGVLVEEGETDSVLFKPQHEYTRALIDAVPIPGDLGRRRRMRGATQ